MKTKTVVASTICAYMLSVVLSITLGCGGTGVYIPPTVPPVSTNPGDQPDPSLPPISQPPGELTPVTNAEDDAILQQILANGENEETVKAKGGTDDRAVCFGNNYPGTQAELHECVNDARKNALNLVKIDKFDPKNIRLFTNQQCTATNYKKWLLWLIKDMKPNESRRFGSNSSHGAQDTTPDGKTVGIICTWDLISTGQWTPEHEVSFQWLVDNLRSTQGNFVLILDQCYAGGSVRPLLSQGNKKIRSIPSGPAAQARIDNAVEHSDAGARLAELTGFVNPACAASELSSEDSRNGGEGTEAYWRARRSLGPTPTSIEIVREENRWLKSIQATQHAQMIGYKGKLWGIQN